MQLFYSEQLTAETKTYTFPREESKHIIKVLRKSQEDKIYITNGKGYLFKTQIIDENPNKCKVAIQEQEYHEPRPYELHIAIAPTKLNDRFEWFLEKATEIGVSQITPLLCYHSERKTIKWERYNRILQSALKQSLQYHLPVPHPLTSFNDFLENTPNTDSHNFIAHCGEGKKIALNKTSLSSSNITILIGPEGDFSIEEIKQASAKQFKAISLGATRLRTETAGLLACSMVAFHKDE